jgi:hypothetical protein
MQLYGRLPVFVRLMFFTTNARETSLPAFLSDSQVRAALQRANSLRPQGHLKFPSSMAHAQPQFQAERDLRDAPAIPFYHVFGYPDSSYPSKNPEQSGVPTKFVPGQETASVLKITKRPRLRPKDISHRQSLGSGEQESSSIALSGRNVSGFTSPPAPPDGRFPHPTPSPESFMVDLAFGQRRVTVPGSCRIMSVDDLHSTASAIANLEPASIRLTFEGVTLESDTFLGDYPRMGLSPRVTVSVQPASSGPRKNKNFMGDSVSQSMTLGMSAAGPTPPRTSFAGPDPPVTLSSDSGTSSFVIIVMFEDSSAMRPVVWGDMEVRHLCQLVAAHSHVSPDTGFLQFAGSTLDACRSLRDPPEIRAGERVYAFFSIERALHCVLRAMQGGRPPPSTPPGPQHFGPPLRPGYARPSPPQTYLSSPYSAPAGNLPRPSAGITRATPSDKLRSTFKCPKCLGEMRHWKVWNKGFVRFLSINQLIGPCAGRGFSSGQAHA